MKLVMKKAPRGKLFRELSADETRAVGNVCGKCISRSLEEKRCAEYILRAMRDHDLWLACGCKVNEEQPLNTAKNLDGTLFLVNFFGEHAKDCPLHRSKREYDNNGPGGSRKHAGTSRVDFRSFLPRNDNIRIPVLTGKDNASKDRIRRRRIPALARLLLTLLDSTDLNRIDPVFPRPARKRSDAIAALQKVTDSEQVMQGRYLSEIIFFDPWINTDRIEERIRELETHGKP